MINNVYYPRIRPLIVVLFGLAIGIGAGGTTLWGFRDVIRSAFDQSIKTKVVQLEKAQVVEVPKIVSVDKIVEVPKIVEVTKTVIPETYSQPLRDARIFNFSLFGKSATVPDRKLIEAIGVRIVSNRFRYATTWLLLDLDDGRHLRLDQSRVHLFWKTSSDQQSKLYAYDVTTVSDDGHSLITSREYNLLIDKNTYFWLTDASDIKENGW